MAHISRLYEKRGQARQIATIDQDGTIIGVTRRRPCGTTRGAGVTSRWWTEDRPTR